MTRFEKTKEKIGMIDSDFRDLVSMMLHPDQKKRLTSAASIRTHPYLTSDDIASEEEL